MDGSRGSWESADRCVEENASCVFTGAEACVGGATCSSHLISSSASLAGWICDGKMDEDMSQFTENRLTERTQTNYLYINQI